MKRRSFLGFLLAAPVAAKVAAADPAPARVVTQIADLPPISTLRSADGSVVIDFTQQTICLDETGYVTGFKLGGDTLADGSIIAEPLRMERLTASRGNIGSVTPAVLRA